MKANYNRWFYEYNKYLAQQSNDPEFNDTRHVDIVNRLKPLMDINSSLLNEQPFGVVSNNNGLYHLVDLLSKSSYTFEDIDQSLIETYKTTLQASMSNMLVNTHAIMFSCKNTNKRYVSYDKLTRTYILDIPFIQLHFGDRDEFIRQKIEKMHTRAKDNYVSLQSFVSNDIESLLGFSILCTVNGYICNECEIAIDDMGFKFRIKWSGATNENDTGEMNFIIYKLDTVRTHMITVDSKEVLGNIIPLNKFNIPEGTFRDKTSKCLVDIYCDEYKSAVRTVPNFGMLDNNGLRLLELQQHTIDDIETHGASSTIVMIVYEIEYLHEIPNIFPAANYYNVLDSRRVYTEQKDGVIDVLEEDDDVKHLRIVSSSDYSVTKMPICTPPIAIDRDVSVSFNTLVGCAKIYGKMKAITSSIKSIGEILFKGLDNIKIKYNELEMLLNKIKPIVNECFIAYSKGALLTTLTSSDTTDKFRAFVNNINAMLKIKDNDFKNVNELVMVENGGYYNLSDYNAFVEEIAGPFRIETIKRIASVTDNFFRDSNPRRFKRPVAEQCFITLQYDTRTASWIFANPHIEHFKGIGNTFYIKNGLTGNEVFKFFVLYTDTNSPAELTAEPLSLETVYDFDKFYDEVLLHMGYIKYWNAENKLMKLSKILYGAYDDETIVQVLAKILAGTINVDDLLTTYGSELKYDEAGETTTAWNNSTRKSEYTEDSLAAPFTINYLFYTLQLMRENGDEFEPLFMRALLEKNHTKRYQDINIADSIDKSTTVPLCFSQYSIAPRDIDKDASNTPIGSSIFYGIPYALTSKIVKTETPYLKVFNLYNDGQRYPYISPTGVNTNEYVSWTDVKAYDGAFVKFTYDIEAAKLFTKYLTYTYTSISDIETNYDKTYDVRHLIRDYRDTIKSVIKPLQKLVNDHENDFQNPETMNIINKILNDNPINEHFDTLFDKIEDLNALSDGKGSIRKTFDRLTTFIRKLQKEVGFPRGFTRRIDKFYKQLKKFDSKLNIYELKQWWNEFDIDNFNSLNEISHPQYTGIDTGIINEDKYIAGFIIDIGSYSKQIKAYMEHSIESPEDGSESLIDSILNMMRKKLVHVHWDEHFLPIAEYCKDVFTNNIFDLYSIANVREWAGSSSSNMLVSDKPYYATMKFGERDYIKSPVDDESSLETEYELVFYVDAYYDDKFKRWSIDSFIPTAEYCFFKGETVLDKRMSVYDASGNLLYTFRVNVEFNHVGSTAGRDDIVNVIPSISTTSIRFENEHEEVIVETDNRSNNLVSNKKTHDMHFELLFGNRYIPLDHDCEYVLDPKTFEEHSRDIVRVPNKMINSLMLKNTNGLANPRMHFKPTQVYHLPKDAEDCITSVYGKCFVGQTVYCATDDGLSVFPIRITAIDHSPSHGFVEAEVEAANAKWFATVDPDTISKYLFEDIHCHIIPDNMMNILKEYNHSGYYHYNIPDLDINAVTPETLPGDPLYVTNNANYIHTRLNYMFHQDIPNRFIDEETKNWKYIYLGEVVNPLTQTIDIPDEPIDEIDDNILPLRYEALSYIQTNGNSALLLDEAYDINTEIFMDFEIVKPQDYQKDIFLFGNLMDNTTSFGQRLFYVYKSGSIGINKIWVNQPFRTINRSFRSSGYLGAGTVNIGRSWISINSKKTYDAYGKNSQTPQIDYTDTFWDYQTISKSHYPDSSGYNPDIPTSDGPIGILGSYGVPGDTIETEFRNDNLYGLAPAGSKLYMVITRNRGEMTHCLIPCTDKETGEPGMFCIITRTFYKSATEEPFIAGQLIEFTPWEEISNLFESMPSNPGSSSDSETEDGNNSEIELVHEFTINLINREIHDITDPELYQTLRDEPDDHDVWKNEIKEFNRIIEYELAPQITGLEHDLYYAEMSMNNATDQWTYKRAVIGVENIKQKIKDLTDRINQIKHYAEQLESPTTWFNVGSYDAAMVYINNGRSILDPSVIVDKIDVPITEKVSVFLYDWEHKKWIDPSTYTISTVSETISTDAKEDYYTRNVVTKMIVTSEQGFTSGDILVYVAYNKSDVYDSIPMNNNSFDVKFKPIISTAKANTVPPYDVINLRKHFDGLEEYVFSGYNAKEIGFNASDESAQDGFYIKRVKTTGKFMDTPILRLKDIHFTPDQFSIYKRLPFKNIHTPMAGYEPSYTAFVNVKIDKFVPGERVRLICIENNADRSFDGTISNVMFEGITSMENDMQMITIVNSTLEPFVSGEYYCSVFQSNDYKSYGGIIDVRVTANREYEMDASNEWVKIPINDKTRDMPIPDEFVLVPNPGQTVTFNATVTLSSTYALYGKAEYNHANKNMINEDNTGDSPYRFYYNDIDHVRYPLSDIRTGKVDKRLVINELSDYTALDQKELKVAHMTYMGIPRYSASRIPEDGVFDVTGYIPTPLSRDRYEWWVNGRCISDDNIIILSPTSFQLKNLQSLKNFELVELVEDKNNSEIIREGNVYTDIHGNTYGSYKLALLSGNAMINQDIKYVFNTSNHKSIHDYTKGITGDPKNIDIEDDIFDTIDTTPETTDKVKYNEMYNLPSINGVTVYNMKSGNFGINEISLDELSIILDKVWKKEIMTNSLFVTSHRSSTNDEIEIILHKKPANVVGINDNRVFVVYASGLMDKYFTLYITTDPTKKIHNTSATQKIIPFIKVGTYVVLDKKYQGMWLCCSEPNVKPIKL